MKKLSLFLTTLCLFSQAMSALPWVDLEDSYQELLIGKPAPNFTAMAVVQGNIVDTFSLADFQGKYVVLFFYPLDFTFVCPTELHAFQEKLPEFEARNAQVIACSVDSVYSHLAWLNTPYLSGGIEGIEYPLVSDLNKEISSQYQVLDADKCVAYRGLFIIDPKGTVRHMLVNDLPVGRNVDEVLRTLDAIAAHEESGDVCPANWSRGKKTLKPTADGLIDYLRE
ncbi:MAG TPA: peroxiredoxin [Rhabdochlamydiaceae bacterium]|jgi:peroxiredoxin (alkyl hydroperoxide reductase subunit C)